MEISFSKTKKRLVLKNSNRNSFTTCKICNGALDLVNSKFNLVQCSNCKLVFAETIFSDAEIEETYDKLYNISSQYETHQKEFEKLKNNTKSNIGRPKLKIIDFLFENKVKSICEVGAGVGLVAKYLQDKQTQYIGIEIDKKTAEKAKSIGLNIVNGDFSLLNSFTQTYDAIIGFEVIEHLQDVDLFFKVVTEKLNSNGYLGFTVPNFEKIKNYKNPESKIYQSGPPIHLNFFTRESIQNIAKIYNYEVVFCKAKKYPYLNWNNKQTYKHLLKALFNNYHGSTIMCVIQKKDGTN